MDATDPFADFPELQTWRKNCANALESFEAELATARSYSGDAGLAHFFNALLQCYLAIGEANEGIGIPFTQSELRAILLRNWPTRDIEGTEARAIATRVAYKANFRSSASGSNDSRIEAAMWFAAWQEGLEGADPIETVRKSIQRLRKKLRGKSVFHLDPATFTVVCLDAEKSLLEGLPGKKGRPRKTRIAD